MRFFSLQAVVGFCLRRLPNILSDGPQSIDLSYIIIRIHKAVFNLIWKGKMAEEQKWQEPEGFRLCANNCGFFGSPTTLNLCSKCYKDHCLKEQQASTAKLAVEISLASVHSSSTSDIAISPEIQVESSAVPAEADAIKQMEVPAAVETNRCAMCRRRVGLTDFNCRCGTTFCRTHRYPEQHGCLFDFKAMGKEEISKANPVVKADKLDKI